MKKLKYIALLLFISFAFFTDFLVVLAAEHTFSVGCKVHFYVNKPGYAKPVETSFTIDRAKIEGYSVQWEAAGDGCSKYYGKYAANVYKATNSKTPDNSLAASGCDSITSKKEDLTFSEILDNTKVSLDYVLYNTKELCESSGKAIKTLSIVGTFSGTASTTTTSGGNFPVPAVETIKNPIVTNSFTSLAFAVMKYFLGAIAGLAIVFIIIGAIQLMVSQGNPEMVTRGKDTITWAVVGVVIALLAFSAVAIVQGLFY